MNSSLLTVTQFGFVGTTLLFFGLALKQLKTALSKSGFELSRQRLIFFKVVISLLIWMVILSGLSMASFFSDFTSFPPRFVIIIIVPMVTLVWALLFANTTKHLLSCVPEQTLVNLQVFRIIVEVLLWLLFIQNLLPIQMTFEGRNFDILAGISAPAIAYLAYSRKMISRKVVIIWNFLCLGLLLNIVVTAILSMPTSFRYFINEPANSIITEFPFIWLPGFLVPLAYGLHFLSLRQLLNSENRTS